MKQTRNTLCKWMLCQQNPKATIDINPPRWGVQAATKIHKRSFVFCAIIHFYSFSFSHSAVAT